MTNPLASFLLRLGSKAIARTKPKARELVDELVDGAFTDLGEVAQKHAAEAQARIKSAMRGDLGGSVEPAVRFVCSRCGKTFLESTEAQGCCAKRR